MILLHLVKDKRTFQNSKLEYNAKTNLNTKGGSKN